jgi:hypothetical protein
MNIYYTPLIFSRVWFLKIYEFQLPQEGGGAQLFIMATLVLNSFWITLYFLTSRNTGWYNIQAMIQFCFRNFFFAHA